MEQANEPTFNRPPIEGTPEILGEYMAKAGLPATWAFGDVFGFDEELLQMCPQPVIAVICNVERLKKAEDKAKGSMETAAGSYYMKQTGVLDNACGVIACIHAILNNLGADKIALPEDAHLSKFLA